MTRGEINLIPTEFKARLKLSLNLGMYNEITQKYLYKQIETDRSVQTVWCEYAWKMSVNSKGSTLSHFCLFLLCSYVCVCYALMFLT